MSRWGKILQLPSLDFKYRIRDEYDPEAINEITGMARAYAINSKGKMFVRFIDKDNNFIGQPALTINQAQNNFIYVVRAFLIRSRLKK